jgi:hypothetical protein
VQSMLKTLQNPYVRYGLLAAVIFVIYRFTQR